MSKNVLIALLTVMSLVLLVSLVAIGFILSKSDADIPDGTGTSTDSPREPGSSEITDVRTLAPEGTLSPEQTTEIPTVSTEQTDSPVITTAPALTTQEPIVTTVSHINTIPPVGTDTPVQSTSPVITTSPVNTTSPVITTSPIITTAPITTTPVITTSAPVTGTLDSSSRTDPLSYPDVSGSFNWSTSNGYWQIFLDWETVTRTDTSAQVKFTVRFYGTSIEIGSREAVLSVNGEDYPLSIPGVSQKAASGKRYNVKVAETTVTVPLKNGCADIGSVLIYPAKYTFSGKKYDNISISGTVKIQ